MDLGFDTHGGLRAQIQAQQGPSWLRAQQGWTSDRIVCLGHSGADGGVRAADHAAARCTAGYATAWLNQRSPNPSTARRKPSARSLRWVGSQR